MRVRTSATSRSSGAQTVRDEDAERGRRHRFDLADGGSARGRRVARQRSHEAPHRALQSAAVSSCDGRVVHSSAVAPIELIADGDRAPSANAVAEIFVRLSLMR